MDDLEPHHGPNLNNVEFKDRKFWQVVESAATQIAKTIPGVGTVVNIAEAEINKIEKGRMSLVINQLCVDRDSHADRLGKIEYSVEKVEAFFHGLNEAAHDPLTPKKFKAYAAAIENFATGKATMDEVVETFDNLRSITANDIHILKQFIKGNNKYENREVGELLGYNRTQMLVQMNQFSPSVSLEVSPLFSNVKRLEGLGVIYLAVESGSGIGFHQFARLREELSKFAHLTTSGETLVDLIRTLPD